MKRCALKNALVFLLAVLALSAVGFFAVRSAASASESYSENELYRLELALKRGAAACYAVEGAYPPDLDYLCENYGVSYDKDRFAVFYEIFAENLMPEITAVELAS